MDLLCPAHLDGRGSLSGLNEYDEQQIRSLSQTDQAFEGDLANLNQELTQNSSFLALEQSEMYLSSSAKAFPLKALSFWFMTTRT